MIQDHGYLESPILDVQTVFVTLMTQPYPSIYLSIYLSIEHVAGVPRQGERSLARAVLWTAFSPLESIGGDRYSKIESERQIDRN